MNIRPDLILNSDSLVFEGKLFFFFIGRLAIAAQYLQGRQEGRAGLLYTPMYNLVYNKSIAAGDLEASRQDS